MVAKALRTGNAIARKHLDLGPCFSLFTNSRLYRLCTRDSDRQVRTGFYKGFAAPQLSEFVESPAGDSTIYMEGAGVQ